MLTWGTISRDIGVGLRTPGSWDEPLGKRDLFGRRMVSFFSDVKRIKKLEADLAESEKDVAKLRKIVHELLHAFVCRLLRSNEYKRSLPEPFSLAWTVRWLAGLKVDHSEESMEAIMKETTDLDAKALTKFRSLLDGLFVKRYPYVDKVVNVFRHSPGDLMNILYDEIPPTPDQGPITPVKVCDSKLVL
ncbi:hypothetical protein Tco_0924663 [Tanacetum coccineum]|uniref:Uncharacterized protein n=1 Tax=Tanacetum coccineum TaxID=301880 RepID=A0ABQ5DAU5_9ASTR